MYIIYLKFIQAGSRSGAECGGCVALHTASGRGHNWTYDFDLSARGEGEGGLEGGGQPEISAIFDEAVVAHIFVQKFQKFWDYCNL